MSLMYYCVDVSGSMGDDELDEARAVVRAHARSKDVVVLFDETARILTPEERDQFLVLGGPRPKLGAGGTDARACMATVEEHAAGREHGTVLVSDEFMGQDHVDLFSVHLQVGPR